MKFNVGNHDFAITTCDTYSFIKDRYDLRMDGYIVCSDQYSFTCLSIANGICHALGIYDDVLFDALEKELASSSLDDDLYENV